MLLLLPQLWRISSSFSLYDIGYASGISSKSHIMVLLAGFLPCSHVVHILGMFHSLAAIDSFEFIVHTACLQMLARFINVNYLELRVGRTTSSSFIQAIYPVIYALQLVIVILQIPQSIDSFRSLKWIQHISMQNYIQGQLWRTIVNKPQAAIQALLCIAFYLLMHFKPLRVSTRLTCFTCSG